MKLILILIGLHSLLHARFLKPEEATYQVLDSNSHLKVNKDYTFEFKHNYKIKILTEQARDQFKIYSFSYISDAEELEIHKITIKDGFKSKEIPSSSFEIKDLSSGAQSFDSIKTIRVPLDGLKIGSEISIKVTRKTLKPNVEGFFATDYSFGIGAAYVLKQSFSVSSEVPLNYKIHDPHGIIAMQKPAHSSKSFSFSLKKPFIFYFTDEPNYTNVSKIGSTVTLTSEQDWKSFSKLYEKNLPNPTKEELNLIGQLLPESKNLTAQQKVEKVIENIISKVTYIGDWKTVKGRYVPRAISDIMKTGYGDCKDNSYLLKTALNKLGIESGLALVNRSNVPGHWINKDLPRLQFNHMISWYKLNEKIYFVDATNMTAESTNIPTDIAGRPVLVLSKDKSYFGETPNIDPKTNIFKMRQTLNIENKEMANLRGSVNVKGPMAMSWRNHLKSMSDTEKEQDMVDSFFVKSRFYNYDISKHPNIDGSGTSDFIFELNGKINPRVIKTSQGMALYPRVYKNKTIDVGSFSKNRLVDYYLGNPKTHVSKLVVKNFILKGDVPKDCTYENDYFKFERKITYNERSKELQQTDTTKVLKSTIPAKELTIESSFYKDLPNYDLCSESMAYMY